MRTERSDLRPTRLSSQWQTVTRLHEKRGTLRLIRPDIVIKARSGTASSFRTKRYRAKSRVPFTRRNTVGHKSHHQTEGASAENPPTHPTHPFHGMENHPEWWWTLMPPFYQGGGRTKTCDASNMYAHEQQMEDFSFNYMWTRRVSGQWGFCRRIENIKFDRGSGNSGWRATEFS